MNQEPQRSPMRETSHLKKKMIWLFGILAIVLIVMSILVTVLEKWVSQSQIEQPKQGTHQTIIFHTPDYDEDITTDSTYMGLDRQIYFCDPLTGVTISLSDQTYAENGEGVALLCHMIESIIAGDHETYNTYFSEEYLEREGTKDRFTAQKLYNIVITRVSTEEQVENGMTYTRETYSLEYMIYRNNGTFRTDVGSDAIRKQAVILTNRTGELLIDVISGYTYSYS